MLSSSLAINDIQNASGSTQVESNPPLIGGFSAPEFFTKYDKQRVLAIAHNKAAKTIMITYPNSTLKPLALKIKKAIEHNSMAKVSLKQADIPDTPTTKYRHDAVIVVLYFR
jgi:hypothetical protein